MNHMRFDSSSVKSFVVRCSLSIVEKERVVAIVSSKEKVGFEKGLLAWNLGGVGSLPLKTWLFLWSWRCSQKPKALLATEFVCPLPCISNRVDSSLDGRIA